MAQTAASGSADSGEGPSRESYDVIVVGAGLGGLAAAAFLAKAGKSVLVVERLAGPGGYAHSFQRGPYLFDPAVHAVSQTREGEFLDRWLRALGVRDRCDFIPLEDLYTASIPGLTFTAPQGVDAFTEQHVELFPHEERGIREFMSLCDRVTEEWEGIPPGLTLDDLSRAAAGFPAVVEYRSAKLGEVLAQFVSDERLRAALTILWMYVGAPPQTVSFLSFAGTLISLLKSGQSYSRGSFQTMVDAWAAAIAANGGELVLGQEVERILVEDGKAAGVVAGEWTIRAPLVISNADMTQTFERLVGWEALPSSYARRIQRMTPATSAFIVYAATTLDLAALGLAHEIFLLKHASNEVNWQQTLRGEPCCLGITAPTVADPSLAPAGEHLFTTVALMPYDIGVPWHEVKERITAEILEQVETVFPGVRETLSFVESAPPTALYKYSLNKNGAMYGWENNPYQTQNRRPGNRTPIDGLYLSSAWTNPGSGTLHAMRSGLQTAGIILGYASGEELVSSLGQEAVPTR
jgi:phytoene desaturase